MQFYFVYPKDLLSQLYILSLLFDLQESSGVTIHRANDYLDLRLEIPRYCCLIELFYFSFLVL